MTGIYVGSTPINPSLGGTALSGVYVGASKVWPVAPAGPQIIGITTTVVGAGTPGIGSIEVPVTQPGDHLVIVGIGFSAVAFGLAGVTNFILQDAPNRGTVQTLWRHTNAASSRDGNCIICYWNHGNTVSGSKTLSVSYGGTNIQGSTWALYHIRGAASVPYDLSTIQNNTNGSNALPNKGSLSLTFSNTEPALFIGGMGFWDGSAFQSFGTSPAGVVQVPAGIIGNDAAGYGWYIGPGQGGVANQPFTATYNGTSSINHASCGGIQIVAA